MTEERLIFRAYQRCLMRTLKKLKDVLQHKDYATAERILDQLY